MEKIKKLLAMMLDSDPMNRPSARDTYAKADSLCDKLEKL